MEEVSPTSVVGAGAGGEAIGCGLEIQVEASQLANMDVFSLSDPFALLQEKTGKDWVEIGRTETIWDVLNPKWVRTFLLPPSTLTSTELKVTIYDRDARTQDLEKHEIIGDATTTIEEIITQRCNGVSLHLQNDALKQTGMVTIIGERVEQNSKEHEVFLGSCKFKNTSILGMFTIRPYITVYRRRSNNEWAPVFRSKTYKRGEDAAFSEDLLHRCKIRTNVPSATCEETPLRIELRCHKAMAEHKLIGAVQMSLGSLRRQPPGKKISLGLAGESVGELSIVKSKLGECSSNFSFEINFHA